mgnify:CR=1 FL=1
MIGVLESLKATIPKALDIPFIQGKMQTIQVCLDPTTQEFYNLGIAFKSEDSVSIKMLDHFERIRSLFSDQIDIDELTLFLQDIERELYISRGEWPTSLFGHSVRLSEPRYASADSEDSVMKEFYESQITFARVKSRSKTIFRYKTTPTLRNDIFKYMKKSLGLRADKIIQETPFSITLNKRKFSIDIPLVSETAISGIASAWYANPLIAKTELLQASMELRVALSSIDSIEKAAISILRPSVGSGLNKKDFMKIDTEITKQVDLLNATGIKTMQGESIEELSEATSNWWLNVA